MKPKRDSRGRFKRDTSKSSPEDYIVLAFLLGLMLGLILGGSV